jgi:hypothetical protein
VNFVQVCCHVSSLARWQSVATGAGQVRANREREADQEEGAPGESQDL